MKKRVLSEPPPIWREAPRYCPGRPFPRYRFVPGLNPHPTEDPLGHSFGLASDAAVSKSIDWRENVDYLFGVDLYNQSYFWEAHESWEPVWRVAAGESRDFLQGLILNAAAQIKLHEGRLRGAATHSRKAVGLLDRVVAGGFDRHWGLGVRDFLQQLRGFYVPLWGGASSPAGTAPPMVLNG